MDPEPDITHPWHQRALPSQQTKTGTTTTTTATTKAGAASSPPPSTKKQASKRTWDDNYQALIAYKSEHGHTSVPNKYAKDRVLATWVSHLREYYNSGQLSQERIDLLEAIGFIWNPYEQRWQESYQRLLAFWRENGHSKVPTHYKPDPALGKWVSRQREDFSGGYMPLTRKKKLDALGFVYRISKHGGRQKRNRPQIQDQWDQKYAELVEFHKIHGHSNVPRPNNGADKLSGWVGVQRTIYNRGLMPQERVDKLRALDFVFNFNQRKKLEEWNKMYELLMTCKMKPDGKNYELHTLGDEASSLSRWIARQKEKYKLYKLEPGRERLLRKLEFPFPQREPRDDGLEQSESLKKTLAEIDNAKAEDLFGAVNCKQGRDATMVEAVLDLAGDDKDLGEKVSESIGLLAKFMSVSPEELATRMSTPMSNRETATTTTPTKTTRNQNSVDAQNMNAFCTLLPLIVRLREMASESEMNDCVDFMVRMVRKCKAEGHRLQPPPDPDSYNKLLTLAVTLSQELGQNQRSQAVIDSCVMYFKHVLEKSNAQSSAERLPTTTRTTARVPEAAPVTKRPRTTDVLPRTIAEQAHKRKRADWGDDWDNELAG